MYLKEELAWAAGLFEGEGSIYLTGLATTTVSLAMSDLDIVERFQRVVGLPVKVRHLKQKKDYKPIFDWRTARFEYAQMIVCLFWPWLGQRRKQQAIECLGVSRNGGKTPGTGHDLRKTHCPQGHLYDEKNTYIEKKGTRVCRACRNMSSTKWYFANKERSKMNKRNSYNRLREDPSWRSNVNKSKRNRRRLLKDRGAVDDRIPNTIPSDLGGSEAL